MSEKSEHVGIDNKSPAERDMIDLNRELAGTSDSRIQRFFTDDALDIYGENDKKKAERHYRSMLQILLADDAQYLALYTQVSETLNSAYQAVDRALIDINQRLQASVEELEFLRENAAELQNGTKVFHSNNNKVFTENGKELSDEIARDIVFLDNATSWEQYTDEKKRYNEATRQKVEVEAYQSNILDHSKNRMNDEDDPALSDELLDIESDIINMPDIVSLHHVTGISSTPDISTQFGKASYNPITLEEPSLTHNFGL